MPENLMKTTLETTHSYFPLVLMLLMALLAVACLYIALWPGWLTRLTDSLTGDDIRQRVVSKMHGRIVQQPRIHRTQHRLNRQTK